MSLLFVVGTRPEAIKMAPVIQQCRAILGDRAQLCVTAQHRGLLDQVLSVFDLTPQFDLNLMKPDQSLASFAAEALTQLHTLLGTHRPARVVVHGDTSTTLMAALAAFYHKIPVAHVEAGLRTHHDYDPFPEEMNRRLVAPLCDLQFAPTEQARQHLLAEGIDPNQIHVTGNTVVDAVLQSRDRLQASPHLLKTYHAPWSHVSEPMILATFHRRENFGAHTQAFIEAIRDVCERSSASFVIPVHPNPNIQQPFYEALGNHPRVHLVPPQDYLGFLSLMMRAHLILTDSGGIQEEAPSLNKPVIVLRNTTERPELIEAGAGILAGTTRASIAECTLSLLNDPSRYEAMAQAPNPYGDGHAAERIAGVLCAPLLQSTSCSSESLFA